MLIETATPETILHYTRKDIMAVIQKLARHNDTVRAGNGDFSTWYKDGQLIDLTKNTDYMYLVNQFRTLYWTLNLFDQTAFTREKINENDVLGTKSETAAYTLGIDIDNINDIHDPAEKAAVEAMGQFFCNELMQYQPKSVHAAFSGGGIYIYLHHLIWNWETMFREYDRDMVIFTVTFCFNEWIDEKSKEFFKMHPEHVGKCKADSLNNSKRVFKTLFSIHKKHPYAVIPLDPHNIKIDFDRARLPLKQDVIASAEDWLQVFDGKNNFADVLREYYDRLWQNMKGITYLPRLI